MVVIVGFGEGLGPGAEESREFFHGFSITNVERWGFGG